MIARLRILLPFTITIPRDENLQPFEFTQAQYRVRVYPPCKAAIDPADIEAISPTPLRTVIELLQPESPQNATEAITMDGIPTVQANLLQVSFLKDDFDRVHRPITQPMDIETHGDPPIPLAFKIANDFLGRLRTLTRGSQIKMLSPQMTFWRLDYLTDTEEELPLNPSMFRRRFGTPVSWRITGMNRHVWSKVRALPTDFTPQIWNNLLLDAEALLPDIGTSITVANAALETFISWCLDQLAPLANLPPDLWEWINSRGDWYKEPSVNEQFDRLLRILTGKSLKDEVQLWEALQNLRQARNSFSHGGKPFIGNKEVTMELAYTLIGRAKEIVDWVEALLPEVNRRPKLERLINFNFQKMLMGPVASVEMTTVQPDVQPTGIQKLIRRVIAIWSMLRAFFKTLPP